MQQSRDAVPFAAQAWHSPPPERPLAPDSPGALDGGEGALFGVVPAGAPCEMPRTPPGRPPALGESPLLHGSAMQPPLSTQSSTEGTDAPDPQEMLMWNGGGFVPNASVWTEKATVVFPSMGAAGASMEESLGAVHERHQRKQGLLRTLGLWNTWLLGSRLGQFVMLVFVGFALVAFGALAWMLSGGNPQYDASWWQSLWIAWCLFIDVGTQTAISVQDSVAIKFVAVMFSLVGFLYCLTLLGILVEIVRDVLQFLEAAYNKVDFVGHVVVLGWTDKTLILIDEILHMLRGKEIRTLDLVILADKDEFKMTHDVRDYLQGRHVQGCRKLRLVCKQGSPQDLNDLRRISAGTARTIMVLGSASRSTHSDLEVMRKMLTLGCKSGEVSGYVFAEVLRSETTPALRTLFPNAEGIHARSAAIRILVLKALKPVVGDCFCNMLTFSYGEELYVVEASPFIDCTFGELCRLCTDSVCVGVQTADSRVVLAPPDHKVIECGDRLIVLAAQESAARSFSVPLPKRRRRSHMERWAARFHPDAIQNYPMCGSEDRDGELDDLGGHVATATMSVAYGLDARALIIIIMGWAEEIADVLKLLDACMPSDGSECAVHVLSEVPLQQRQADLDTAAIGDWDRIQLRHHVGSRLSVKCLGQLPLWDADAILVLSEARFSAMESDSECLTCAVTISGIREGKYPGFHDAPRRWKGLVICEILDARTDRLLMKNTMLTSTLNFFRSNALETGLFAMAVHEPATFNALVSLLRETPDGGSLAAEPIATYDPAFTSAAVSRNELPMMSFWELHERVRSSGDLLLGWKKHREAVVLVPLVDRHEVLPWSASDRLIVIRKCGLDTKWGKATHA